MNNNETSQMFLSDGQIYENVPISEYIYQNNTKFGVDIDERRVREKLFDILDEKNIVEIDCSVPESADICIVDTTAIQTNAERFASWQERREQVFAPVVIISDTIPESTNEGHIEKLPFQPHCKIHTPISKQKINYLIRNLSHRQKLSEENHECNKLTDAIFHSGPLAKLILDPDGTIERANQRASELLGADCTDLIGKSYCTEGEIEVAKNEKRILQNGLQFEQVKKTGEPVSDHECIVQQPDHNDSIVSVNVVPLPRNSESVESILVTFEDITNHRDREEKLRQLTKATNEAPIGIVLTDPTRADNPIVYANDGFVQQTGYTRDEVIGRNCRFLQGEGTNDGTVAELRRAIEAEKQISTTIWNYKADGTGFWNRLEISPISNDDGTITNFIGFQQDVTKQKEWEVELKETKQHLDLVLSETDTGVWTFNPNESSVLGIEMPDAVDVGDKNENISTYLEQIHPDDRESVREAIMSAIESGSEFDIEFRLDDDTYERWLRSYGTVTTDNTGDAQVVGITTEVTERVHRKNALKKREQVLRKLHTATRELHPTDSKQDVVEFVVDFLSNGLDLTHVSMMLYDADEGVINSVCHTSEYEQFADTLDSIPPGSNPIWEAYQNGESSRVSRAEVEKAFGGVTDALRQLHIFPIGDYGVLSICMPNDDNIDNVDIDLIELVCKNAENGFQQTENKKVETRLVEQLSEQENQIEQLREVVGAIHSIQQRVSEAESRSDIDNVVCEELVRLNVIDFVWIGRPQATDTTLSMTASAGGGRTYLDSVRSIQPESEIPAQIAADKKEPYKNDEISKLVREEDWAKGAVSQGYESVLSVPVVQDEVLYGVLTAYSHKKSFFNDVYENLLSDTSIIVRNYSQILNRQPFDQGEKYTIATFQFNDSKYLLQQLAADTNCKIILKTISQTAKDSVSLVIKILEADREKVREYATNATAIKSAIPFGIEDAQQLMVEIPRPCFVTKIERYGGKVVSSKSITNSTEVRLKFSNCVEKRPLYDYLNSHFNDVELVSQKEITNAEVSKTDSGCVNDLTKRQLEILNAAYYGGYYETPRDINGEDLAESFNISSPAIYNHLQNAHKKILNYILEDNHVILSTK